MNRIHWEDEEVTGNTIGRVGTIGSCVFVIYPAGPTPANVGAGGWRIISGLPGQSAWGLYRDDPEALKAEAERWLEKFVSSLGAVFPEWFGDEDA